jgi:hypothetical protein
VVGDQQKGGHPVAMLPVVLAGELVLPVDAQHAHPLSSSSSVMVFRDRRRSADARLEDIEGDVTMISRVMQLGSFGRMASQIKLQEIEEGN